MQRLIHSLRWLLVLSALGYLAFSLRDEIPASRVDAERLQAEEVTSAARRNPQDKENGEGRRQSHTQMQQLMAAIGCAAPAASNEATGIRRRFHSWLRELGAGRFFDDAPTPTDGDLRTPAPRDAAIFITVRAEDAVLPDNLEVQISSAAKRSYEQWQYWLGAEALVPSQINLRFLGDAQRFAKLYGRPHNDEFTAVGFYRIRSNEALILYTPEYRAMAVATAFHELSHLITASHLGPTAPWLDEGIAEYFETLQLRGQRAEFTRNRQHLMLLYREGLVPLAELTALSRGDWTREDAPRRYASAWALIAFFLDSAAGEATLKALLREAYAQRCNPASDPAGLLGNYPGGVIRLEQDWQRWLKNQFGTAS